jgi:phosphocarrier protein
MKTFSYTITDPLGLHARPAGLLVKTAQGFGALVTIEKSGRPPADLKKLFAVMGLAIKCGDIVAVRVEGAHETEAAAALEEFFRANF